MYRIKPQKGYNVIISDLNLVLKSANDTWTLVEKEKLDNSTDAKAVWKLLIIEDADKVDDKKEKAPKKETKTITQTENNAFVAHNEKPKQPQGVFVATPDPTPTVETKVTEEVKPVETKVEEKVEEVKPETSETEKKQSGKKNKKPTAIEPTEN